MGIKTSVAISFAIGGVLVICVIVLIPYLIHNWSVVEGWFRRVVKLSFLYPYISLGFLGVAVGLGVFVKVRTK
jgi:hypothetical protein